jgi:hypothetical protein
LQRAAADDITMPEKAAPKDGTSLGVYLNDHFAGAVAAIELLGLLESAQEPGPSRQTVISLREEITKDQAELRGLMTALGIALSSTRRVSAWLTEKLTEVKLRVDDPGNTGLRRFEILEALAVGVDGKRALWAALDACAAVTPALRQLDYTRLLARAEHQRRVIEALRLDAAKAIV